MKQGGKRLFIVPPHLAYGSRGLGDRVPPNSALIFDVHVIRVSNRSWYICLFLLDNTVVLVYQVMILCFSFTALTL